MLPEKLEGNEFQEYLSDLIKEDSKFRHVNYGKTVEHAKEMAVHAWGRKPTEILERARPREEDSVRQYRLSVWEPITQSKFDKSISILQKIFNSKLYSTEYPPQPGGIKLKEDETLEYYLTQGFPLFDSIYMFLREVLLKKMIADPNAVLSIVPTKYDLPQNEFQAPNVVIFASEQVIDFKEGSYFIFKDQNKVKSGKKEGAILHVFLKNSIITYHETFSNDNQAKSRWIEFSRFDHNYGILPAWFLGGITDSETWPYFYKSFFNAALPYWNKAIMRDSDLDGAYVNHLHPQKWELTMECDYSDGVHTCNGGQFYFEQKKHYGACPKCKGDGSITVKSPFDVYKINPNNFKSFGEKDSNIPFDAPAGYINVPVEIIDKLENRVEKDIDAGLSAINMEIVNTIGANQSGVAKEYDRSELHSFMQQISDYIYDNHLPNIIYFINLFRYGVILGNKVDEYLPTISKPTNFDILTIKELTQEISQAKESNANTAYITALQKESIGKRFSTNREIKNEAMAIVDLDPFPNLTIDDKMNMGLDGSVAKTDIVISNNIISFVRRALDEVKGFLELDRRKQLVILEAYANELLNKGKPVLSNLVQLPGQEGMDTPNDIEAEAAAKLKGSVGGAQVITGFVEKVSQGLMNRDAAIESLKFLFKIDDAQASLLLGPISKKPALTLFNDTGPISQ